MNDPENDTVAALFQALQPAAPSRDLLRRLAAARPIAKTISPRAKIIAFIPRISMAAALLALAGALTWKFLPLDETQTTTETAGTSAAFAPPLAAALTPRQSRQRLLGVQDLGLARDSQQRPVRLMRTTWLDDDTFTPPGGAPPLRQSRMRDEIVPVVVQTY